MVLFRRIRLSLTCRQACGHCYTILVLKVDEILCPGVAGNVAKWAASAEVTFLS